MDPLGVFRRIGRGLRNPAFTFHRGTLRDRRPARQHGAEIHVMPMRQEMNPAVVVEIAVDQSGQGREWQVEAIDRVREQ